MISLIHHGDSSWAIHLNDFEDSCWVYVFKAVSVLKIENVCACFIELNAHEKRSLCLWIFLGSSLTMKASNSKGFKNIASDKLSINEVFQRAIVSNLKATIELDPWIF